MEALVCRNMLAADKKNVALDQKNIPLGRVQQKNTKADEKSEILQKKVKSFIPFIGFSTCLALSTPPPSHPCLYSRERATLAALIQTDRINTLYLQLWSVCLGGGVYDASTARLAWREVDTGCDVRSKSGQSACYGWVCSEGPGEEHESHHEKEGGGGAFQGSGRGMPQRSPR